MFAYTMQRRCIMVGISLLVLNAGGLSVATEQAQYSHYLNEDYPNQVFFGDTHLHTSYSADAGLFGNTLGPEEAYQYRAYTSPIWYTP